MNKRTRFDLLEKLVDKCDGCDFSECINCEISWTEVQALKDLLNSYTYEVEKSNRYKELLIKVLVLSSEINKEYEIIEDALGRGNPGATL